MSGISDYSSFSTPRRKRSRNPAPILFVMLIPILSFFLINKTQSIKKETVSKTMKPIVKKIADKGFSFFDPNTNSEPLGSIVQDVLKNSQGKYAVAIKNLKTGERYYYNEHLILDSASLYKLFVMATVFQKIQSGNLSQNDVLTEDISVLNDKFGISSESAELTEGDITLPVQSALSKMITISDNYSALLLTEKIRLSQVALFLDNNSFEDTRVGTNGENPTTSAYDISLFYEKLYHEEFANKDLTTGMLALLKHQMLNGKIPKYIPKNVDISHKTGELGTVSHDGGIVFTPKGNYIITILSDTPSPPIANENIAKISKAVYDYFMSQP